MIEKYNSSGLRENQDQITLTENQERVSMAHNVTVTVSGEIVAARQINNVVPLDALQRQMMREISNELKAPRFNIPASKVIKLFDRTIQNSDIITNPVSLVLISSEGLLNSSEWTSNQPSEGIWVLAEWMSRLEPSAAPTCIDPNMLSRENLVKALQTYSSEDNLSVFGFSLLPVNLRNDISLVSLVKKTVPKSIILAGGIGSDSLGLLPTADGKRGITEALPVDVIIPGTAVQEMAEIVRAVHEGKITDKSTLQTYCADVSKKIHATWRPADFAEMIENIQKSRETVHTYFIPETRPDLVHEKSYQEANQVKETEGALRITPVLVDNSCGQNCFFCASPKSPIFSSMEDAAKYISRKSKYADVIAFNDNDLSNTPNQTIELCRKMRENKILQPKHGKLRASEYNPELLDALAEAGFVRIAIGVESFSEKIRSSLGKKDFTTGNIEKTLNHLLSVGICPEINLILFTPREDIETLKETVVKALGWADRGASLYVTLGLFATPNSPGVMQVLKEGKNITHKIDFDEIKIPDTEKTLLFPTQWKGNKELQTIKGEVIAERGDVLKRLSSLHGTKIPVPIEAYATLILLANLLQIEGYRSTEDTEKMISDYASKHIHTQYISI